MKVFKAVVTLCFLLGNFNVLTGRFREAAREMLAHTFRYIRGQEILAGTLTGVQGDILWKVLAALSTVK